MKAQNILRHVFHYAVKKVRGVAIVRNAAYLAGVSLYDLQDGVRRDFSRRRLPDRDEIVYSDLVLPGGRQESIESFWNRVRRHNRQKRAVCARVIDAALSVLLSEAEMIVLVSAEARRLSAFYGVGVQVAIHRPRSAGTRLPGEVVAAGAAGRDLNWHVHFLLSYCVVRDDGVLMKKQPLLDPNNCARLHVQNFCEVERPAWADASNAALARAGRIERVDHRTLREQGLLDVPTTHLGPAASALEAVGKRTLIGDRNRRIREENIRRRRERAARRQRFVQHRDQRQRQLDLVRRAMRRGFALETIRLPNSAASREVLRRAHAQIRQKIVRIVDWRLGMIFARDGGCAVVNGPVVELIALGDSGELGQFLRVEIAEMASAKTLLDQSHRQKATLPKASIGPDASSLTSPVPSDEETPRTTALSNSDHARRARLSEQELAWFAMFIPRTQSPEQEAPDSDVHPDAADFEKPG